jgi:alpha-amylase
MSSVCFCFEVHQPLRLRNYTVFDTESDYFDDFQNAQLCMRAAANCYLPANLLMLDLIKKYKGKFRIAYSITGTLLDQLRLYVPEVLDSFRQLAATGCVEFLAETYDHSLSFLYSRTEFIEQVKSHRRVIQNLFGQTPRVFCSTEHIYTNQLARLIEQIGGFDAILTEGADRILGSRSPNFLYRPPTCRTLKLLLKNCRLSDDVTFRFSDHTWNQWPLNAKKFAGWISAAGGHDSVVNLFMDYEIFKEHQCRDTGMFDFLRHLPQEILSDSGIDFKTPSEIAAACSAVDVLDVADPISWADREGGISAWTGNPMQINALDELYRLESSIKSTKDEAIIADWRKLQAADHFYYMCMKRSADRGVHRYFSPYESPYDSYINFMNVLDNLELRCSKALLEKEKTHRRPRGPVRMIPEIQQHNNPNVPCITERTQV